MSSVNDPVVLRERRQTTDDLIREHGLSVALTRPQEPISDGAGGMADQSAESPQNAAQRFLGYPQTDQNVTRDFDRGSRVSIRFVLVGPHDDDIAPGDWFDYDGAKHVVDHVHTDRSFETRAEGMAHWHA